MSARDGVTGAYADALDDIQSLELRNAGLHRQITEKDREIMRLRDESRRRGHARQRPHRRPRPGPQRPTGTPMSRFAIPPIEAVEYGRSVLFREVEHLKLMEAKSTDPEAKGRWLRAWWVIEHDLLGPGEGCVIRPFDARWLDQEFRESNSRALP